MTTKELMDMASQAAQPAQEQGEPCDMKELCIGCSPRLANGKCPSTKPNGSCDCYVTGFNDGMKEMDGMRPHLDGIYIEALEAFAALVAAAEREACAKVCVRISEKSVWEFENEIEAIEECVAAIRARGK